MKKFAPLIGLLVIAAVIAGVFILQKPKAENSMDSNDTGKASQSTNLQDTSSNSSSDQLQITDEKIGDGAEAVAGKTISVHYTGTLTNGTKFDSSYDRNQPFEFVLGSGQVIKGWDQGFAGMKIGGKRKLVIPPSLGYGSQSVGSIPPNSTLVFEVELLDVK